MSTINFVESKPVSMDVVAPRHEQPVQAAQWKGHESKKFKPERAHVKPIEQNPDAKHPLFSTGGRRHFDEKRDV